MSSVTQATTPIRRSSSQFYVRGGVTGVYALFCRANGAAYVGGSARCIRNRVTWHLAKLRSGQHSSHILQEEWDATSEDDWEIRVLEVCSKETVSDRERHWSQQFEYLLTEQFDPVTKQTRHRISEGRTRYLQQPGARERLSEQARRQHREGRF